MYKRPELCALISGRVRERFDAKIKNLNFDEAAYTKMVVEKIKQAEDISYNEKGFTYLHLAVQEREPDFVIALLEKGVDINSGSESQSTPLCLAIGCSNQDGMMQIIKLLLEHGADYTTKFGKYSAKDLADMFELDLFK